MSTDDDDHRLLVHRHGDVLQPITPPSSSSNHSLEVRKKTRLVFLFPFFF